MVWYKKQSEGIDEDGTGSERNIEWVCSVISFYLSFFFFPFLFYLIVSLHLNIGECLKVMKVRGKKDSTNTWVLLQHSLAALGKKKRRKERKAGIGKGGREERGEEGRSRQGDGREGERDVFSPAL